MKCTNCGSEVQETSFVCTNCWTVAGYSNVRMADRQEEVAALRTRYQEALQDAGRRNVLGRLNEFEAAVKQRSQVVVGMDAGALECLMRNSGVGLYSNYQKMVEARLRKPALLPFDQRRMAVDGKLWGIAGSEITYGALALDGHGLPTFGVFFVTLRERDIAHRASVLTVNSFDFVESTSQALPLGHRASWANRHLVAVAKCAPLINELTEAKGFPAILMTKGATRADDDFVEVHIYGAFSFQAIESIGNHPIREKRDQLMAEIIREHALREGITWPELS